ncbi:MAG TPA: hypothetical protein VFV80_13700 [Geminicoccaceae bacterium]|nr:hypothetical protein [Geminicoccaceae bacterium]
MDRERAPAWRQAGGAKGGAERADASQQAQVEGRRASQASPGDYGNREAWRRLLAAYIQPLPEAD